MAVAKLKKQRIEPRQRRKDNRKKDLESSLTNSTVLPGNQHQKLLKKKTEWQQEKFTSKESTPKLQQGRKSKEKMHDKTQSMGSEGTEQSNLLLEEILHLGGSEEDMKLVKDVDEDDIEENIVTGANTENMVKLNEELRTFMKSSGFDFRKFKSVLDLKDDEVSENEGKDNLGSISENEDKEKSSNKGVKSVLSNSNGKNRLKVEPTPKWYAIELEPLEQSHKKPSSELLMTLTQKAKDLLNAENSNYEIRPSNISTSDRQFLTTILSSGTLNDKVSALTLLAQESPLHGIKALEQLTSMARKKARKEAMMAVTSLKDLLIGSVLPERKLKYLEDWPINAKGVTDRHLILWAFEDFLKRWFFEFIKLLEVLSLDPLPHIRQQTLTVLYDLFTQKPEQEQNLLRMLVNKLGDSVNKVTAKASYLLTQVANTMHPGMKIYIIRDIEQLMLRPNVSERAQYYGTITLNQMILRSQQEEIANKLIDVYFLMFRKLLAIQEEKEKDDQKQANVNITKRKHYEENQKKEAEEPADTYEGSKTISALLTGINRAFPFARIPPEVYESHLQVLFRITHTGTFNTSIQALQLIYQVSSENQSVSDRFYRTLYESLLDPRLLYSSKQAMYLNLLFRALRNDTYLKRIKAFVKRLCQVAVSFEPAVLCGALYLIDQLMQAQPELKAMISLREDNDEEEIFVDVSEEVTQIRKNGQIVSVEKTAPSTKYDGRKRDPQFSNADKACLWELIPFVHHFHPTVCLYASNILAGVPISPKPELHHHTLMHFLDLFVYRNAKKTSTKGGSIMQPSAAAENIVMLSKPAKAKEMMMNSESFWRKKLEDVPVDQIFFHKYFTERLSRHPTKHSKKAKKSESAEGIVSEDDIAEDDIWQAMVGSMPSDLADAENDNDDLDDIDDEEDEEIQKLLLGSDDDEDDDEDDEGEEDNEGDEDDYDDDDDDDVDNDDDDVDVNDVEGNEESEVNGDGEWEDIDKTENEIHEKDSSRASKRRKTRAKDLPIFASFDDYADIIAQDDIE